MCSPTSYFNRENCDKDAAKVLRKYYKRPYFLPPMAEAVEGNWFIVSSAQNMTLHVSSLFLQITIVLISIFINYKIEAAWPSGQRVGLAIR